MTVRVLIFAYLAEQVGTGALQLELSDNATVADAMAELGHRYSAIEQMRPRLAVSVNHEYVQAHHDLSEGDELALIPPVSGG